LGDPSDDVLDRFLPPVAAWFRERFGEPTPPQARGWPAIAAGESTLIFAPTGSGKTLAAFLACLDHLWRTPRTTRGVRILYVSPLKALNNDISRNLEAPLAGVLATAEAMGTPLEPLTVAVRTGDTPTAERQRILRRPPDILITTPESLHLMLTSRAREVLRTVTHVLVDEIHALASNKRGVFLGILMERLEALTPRSFVRVGLSATQRPLDEVARYLGGLRRVSGRGETARFEPRPVTIVDAGRRKELDLEVSFPAASEGPIPQGGVWPAVDERLMDLIGSHRSTIVFVNNRRVAESITARLNDRANEDVRADTGAEEEPRTVARSHHGSLSLDARRATEEALKEGELPAVIATASLELGIDMGAVDLVCQVESPGGVARGLQRVGRAGHIVGRVSKGRLIAKTYADLVESAALARAMLKGDVERLRVPTNCLDVLAQQVIATVAVGKTTVTDLFDLMRGAYAYRDLTAAAFEGVLKMVSGRYGVETFRDLKPRISWDRVHNVLHPLPGSAQHALINGGTIPDTGQYPLYLGSEEGPRLGELDEEFVLERRVGDTFRLGASTWRIESIDPQRVIVSPAAGRSALMPFWRGEGAGRTAELGEAVGELCREAAARLDDPDGVDWLATEYRLEPKAAGSLLGFIRRQIRQAGAVPDDRTVLVETFRDQSGETGLAVLTPFGHRLHHALKIVLQARLRRRFGIDVACLHDDNGLLIRLPGMDDPPLDVFAGLTADAAESLIREELGDSALFGLRFRQNAGRALLMPRPDPSKRTPLWLQRLRARDLLQAVRRFPDFPIVVETFRECLDADLDLPRLRAFLDAIGSGTIRVVERKAETSSPFASELIFRFTLKYLYEWDEPRRGDRPRAPLVDEDVLDPLLASGSSTDLLDPDAVGRVDRRLRGTGQPPRTADEMAETLRRLGDLAPSELAGPMLGFLVDLQGQGRATTVELAGTSEPSRWINAEDGPLFASAFGAGGDAESVRSVVRRFVRTRALVGLDELLARYPIDPGQATELLESLAEEGDLVRLDAGPDGAGSRWAERGNLEEARRLTIAMRRRESVAVSPEVFADFIARRQHAHPDERLEGESAVEVVLGLLQGFAAPLDLWESEILPRRIVGFRPSWLAETFDSRGWTWRARAEGRGDPRLAFVARDFAGGWPKGDEEGSMGPEEALVLDYLSGRGACFVDEVANGTGLRPSVAREALRGLAGRGHVTADRLGPLRPGSEGAVEVVARTASEAGRSGRPRLGGMRRPATPRPEPRWSTCRDTGEEDPEASALAWASVLLDRYGVLSRETVAMDVFAPPWRELVPHLSRAEMRGELRRGYFVEGLSGVQFALAETAEALARAGSATGAAPRPILLSSLDPANLYGAGAPLDIPLLEGGTSRMARSSANHLILIAGRPVLIIEGHGRRLTGLASASEAELRSALALVPTLAGPSRRILKVETYNTAPALASPAAPWLAEVGFVRDHPGMAYYAGW
jgi:ATP-dependent Lhr-like helicase